MERLLPLDIWIMIFAYFTTDELLTLRSVCRYWQSIIALPRYTNAYMLKISSDNMPDIWRFLQPKRGRQYSLMTCVERFQMNLLPHCKYSELVFRIIGGNIRWLKLDCQIGDIKFVQRHCPNLVTLIVRHESFNDFENVDLSNLKSLEVLDFDKRVSPDFHVVRDTDETMFTLLLAENIPFHLKSLTFEWNPKITGKAVLHVLHRHSATLEALYIGYCIWGTLPIVHEQNWKQTINELTNLKQLSLLRYSGRGTNRIIKAFSKAPIEKLDMTMSRCFMNHTLATIVQQWHNTLQHLDISLCPRLTDAGMLVLFELRHVLRVLYAGRNYQLSEQGLLNGIAKEPNYHLRELDCDSIYSKMKEGLTRALLNLPNLTYLNVAYCQALCDELVATICNNLIHLKQLHLDGGTYISDSAMIGNELSKGIWNLRHLEELSMTGCRSITNATLQKGFRFDKLNYLNLSTIPYLSSQGFTQLVKNCPNLKELYVISCRYVTETDLVYFRRNLKHLRVLNWDVY